jgi:hypothetical protein
MFTPASSQEEVSTIFMVGFPKDFSERELQNMFLFSPGFEGSSLKSTDSFSQFDLISQGTDSAISNLSAKGVLIGFARFSSRRHALQAIQVISGKSIEIDNKCILKVDMAKKNLPVRKSSFVSPLSISTKESLANRSFSSSGLSSDLTSTSSNETLSSPSIYPWASMIDNLIDGGEQSESDKNSDWEGPWAMEGSPPSSMLPQVELFGAFSSANKFGSDSLFYQSGQTYNDRVKQSFADIACSPFPIGTTPSESLNESSLSTFAPFAPHHSNSLSESLSINASFKEKTALYKNIPNLADQNPPCNTLYVGNLPPTVIEEELKKLFGECLGYKRLCVRYKGGANPRNGPMCFVEFESEDCATNAMTQLNGHFLSNSEKGGIRLSYSKNPLGVRRQIPISAPITKPAAPQAFLSSSCTTRGAPANPLTRSGSADSHPIPIGSSFNGVPSMMGNSFMSNDFKISNWI